MSRGSFLVAVNDRDLSTAINCILRFSMSERGAKTGALDRQNAGRSVSPFLLALARTLARQAVREVTRASDTSLLSSENAPVVDPKP